MSTDGHGNSPSQKPDSPSGAHNAGARPDALPSDVRASLARPVNFENPPAADITAEPAAPVDTTIIHHPAPQTTLRDSLPDAQPSLNSLGPIPSLPRNPDSAAQHAPHEFPVGSVLFEFQIQRVLGRGAFGTVYLALHLSLNRFVALKVARDLGAEGRTMARLEHRNIVQVYSEHVVAEQQLRLLCLQFIPGPSLQHVLDQLRAQGRTTGWSGQEYLQIVDDSVRGPSILELNEVSERSQIRDMDFLACVCHVGAELADGLQFAHAAGVIHRDIKPANILINAYGRPLLADFNLAEEQTDGGRDNAVFGGTLAWMAPEHLRVFRDGIGNSTEVVREPADLYALSLILLQMLTGRNEALDHTSGPLHPESQREFVDRLIAAREQPPELLQVLPVTTTAQVAVAHVLARVLDPDPARRTPSARQLQHELRGCLRLHSLDRQRSRSPLRSAAGRFPLGLFALLALLPHMAGSAVNICYNVARLPELPLLKDAVSRGAAGDLSERGATVMESFRSAISLYNIIVWPVCLVLITRLIVQNLAALRGQVAANEPDERERRRCLIAVPRRLAIVAMIGWVPGLVIFPVSLWLMARVNPVAAAAHFATNLVMSGSIAFSYSYVGVTWLIVENLYPRQWSFPAGLNEPMAGRELRQLTRPLSWCLTMAGLIPLLSAMLIVVTSPSQIPTEDYTMFRVLLTSLIGLGMLGYHLSGRIIRQIQQTVLRYDVASAAGYVPPHH